MKPTRREKIGPHLHDYQYPVKNDDSDSYLIKCSLCPREIKITRAQFEKGEYTKLEEENK